MDRISNLADNLIDLILDELPLKDRVKTSVLSKSWRFKWTFSESYMMDKELFNSTPKSKSSVVEYASIVSSLLFQHRACLREFYLYIPGRYLDRPSVRLLQHSIGSVVRAASLHELTLEAECYTFVLPSSIFSAVNLRRLEINSFFLHLPICFKGFPNLIQFVYSMGEATKDTINRFVSCCPRLEEFELEAVYIEDAYGDFNQIVELEAPNLTHLRIFQNFFQISVPHAQNLEYVDIYYDNVEEEDAEDANKCPGMFNFFNKATQLQHISFNRGFCKYLGKCSVIDMLPRFHQMKSLEFYWLCLNNRDELRCLLSFCASSPNVKDLVLKIMMDEPPNSFELEPMVGKYINADFRELTRIDISGVSGTKIEMKIIESLLCFSPILEVMNIDCNPGVVENMELHFDEAVTEFYRASSKAIVRITS